MYDDVEYLIPNWHSITDNQIDFHLEHHRYTLSSLIDGNGTGIFNDVQLKNNKQSQFASLNPSVPFHINESRVNCKYKARNCLLHLNDGQEDMLLYGMNNYIKLIKIKENQHFYDDKIDITFDRQDDDVKDEKFHKLSHDYSLQNFPFVHHAVDISKAHSSNCFTENPILELKQNVYEGETQINVISRKDVQFLKVNENEQNELELLLELNIKDITNDDSSIAFCDRNPYFRRETLFCLSNSGKYQMVDYNCDTQKVIWSFNEKVSNENKKHCGLAWSQFHRKMMFHARQNEIRLLDSRGKREKVVLFEKGKCDNLHDWELFYQMMPNLLNENQFFVATDFRLFCGDIRYPNQSMIQFNHMLNSSLINNLTSSIYQKQDSKQLILMANDFHKSSMFILKNLPSVIQPVSCQLPLFVSTPKDFEKHYHYYLNGTQLIQFKSKNGFSCVQLNNFGDLFVQDYFDDCEQLKEKCNCSGIGAEEQIDNRTQNYIDDVNKHIIELCKKQEILITGSKYCTKSHKAECKQIFGVCVCRRTQVEAEDHDRDHDRDEDRDEDSENEEDKMAKNIESIETITSTPEVAVESGPSINPLNGFINEPKFGQNMLEAITNEDVFKLKGFDYYTDKLLKEWNLNIE